ncbi:MAG: hypothetical protein D4R50_01190 [Actinomycetales bacterium]|nr:MAG: hypothetical protein D4R50_01190 [Actinomycetales bacterium]
MDSEKTKTLSEIIKNVAQVLALIVAGLWAYTQFQETEGSSLEMRGSIESKLSWFAVADPNYCGGELRVKIKNIGRKSFDLKSATMRVWLVDSPSFDQTIAYIDPNDFRTGKPIFEKQFSGAKELPLLTRFPPDVESAYDFTFNFKIDKRDKNIALFSFDGNGSELELHTNMWDYFCDRSSPNFAVNSLRSVQ